MYNLFFTFAQHFLQTNYYEQFEGNNFEVNPKLITEKKFSEVDATNSSSIKQLSINVRMVALVEMFGTSARQSDEISHSRKPRKI